MQNQTIDSNASKAFASSYHIPVLFQECLSHLNIKPNGVYVDATFGGGGHSKGILSMLGPEGRLIAFDQDADAQQNLPKDNRLCFYSRKFQVSTTFFCV